MTPVAAADDIGSKQHFLRGGNAVPTGKHEAVGALPGCTASYIGNRRVLTAAHCVCPEDDTPVGCSTSTTFRFVDVLRHDDPATPQNESLSRGDVVFTGSVRVYERFGALDALNGPRAWLSNDFAILTLDRSVSDLVRDGAPLRIATRRNRPKIGDPLTLVGFGRTGGDCNAAPQGKREITLPLWERSIGNVTLRIGTDEMGACPGDSGGPALNSAGEIVGVSSSIPGNYDPVELAANFIAGFRDLGGNLGAGPGAVQTDGGRFEVFVRGAHNGELVQRSWDGQRWSGWKNLGGDIVGAPSVVHLGNGRLEVFVRGKHNDELVQRSWDGRRWSGWKNLGGDIAAGPAAVYTGGGRIEVFVRGKHNDELVQRSWDGRRWSGWKNLGGDIAAAPSAIHTGGGQTEVFVRGKHNDELVQRSWDGRRWSGWKNHGGDLTGAPAAVVTAGRGVTVFGVGQRGELLHGEF